MTASRKTGPKPAQMEQMEHFFVYGTLAPGRPNAHVLADIDGTWTPATVRGSLVDDGWGAALGYPGIVLSEGRGLVHGLVFSSPQLSTHWQRLDEFEGEGYARVPVTAILANGDCVPAWIYALAEAAAACGTAY